VDYQVIPTKERPALSHEFGNGLFTWHDIESFKVFDPSGQLFALIFHLFRIVHPHRRPAGEYLPSDGNPRFVGSPQNLLPFQGPSLRTSFSVRNPNIY
jgi:hypothetical protein